MDTVGKRLRKLIEIEGVNLKEFCDNHGLNYSSFSQITLDKRELGANVLKQMVKSMPNLNANWVLFGIGNIENNIYGESKNENNVNETPEIYQMDVMERVFIKYLNTSNVKNELKKILHEEIKPKK